jgi:serine/threonine protein kinase
MDLRVGGRFRLRKPIGAGSFGEIYSGEEVTTHESVAIKLEPTHSRVPQLAIEYGAYRLLVGSPGIPRIEWYGTEGDCNVLVMELLGKSIEGLFVQCERHFSLKTVVMLADQMITRLEYIHSKGYLHRDIKPENFAVGLGRWSNTVFILDFGLAKRFLDSRNGQHIPFRIGRSLTGTARYASINNHRGCEQSRRDDVEALAYVLIYLLRGSLPWMGLSAETRKQKYDAIAERKLVTSVDVLCDGLPQEFGILLSEARRLEFTERPDYALYRTLFRELMLREGFIYDYHYDWLLGGRVATSPFGEPGQTPMGGMVPQVVVPLPTRPAVMKGPGIRDPRAPARGQQGKRIVARIARLGKR